MRLAHPARREAAAPRGRAEVGETLLEVLVTVILMGIAFAGIFSGMYTVAKVSWLNQQRTIAGNTIQAWTESIQQPADALADVSNPRASFTYVPCATVGQLYAPMPSGALRPGWTAEIVSVEYLTGYSSGGAPQFSSNVADCTNAPGYTGPFAPASQDRGLQRITIRVSNPSTEATRIVDTHKFLKRDQRCPAATGTGLGSQAAFDNADLGPC